LDTFGAETYRNKYEPELATSIDIKTLRTAAQQLAAEGKIKSFTVQSAHDTRSNLKRCIMRADIRMDDPETKAYIDYIRSPAYKQDTAMDHMSSRMKKQPMDLRAKPLPEQPSVTSVTRLWFTAEKQLKAKTVLGTMKNYGYIYARFRRAALLHRFLTAHRLQAIAVDPRKAAGDYPFSVAWFYKEMPVSLYFQIIGIRKVTNALNAFLEENSTLEIPLDYVSASVSAQIFPIGASFHRKLWQSIMVLYHLGLIDMKQDLDTSDGSKPTSIEVLPYGVVRDYKLETPCDLTTHKFNSMEDVRTFWIALEAECINPKVTEGAILKVYPVLDTERDRTHLSSSLDHIGLSRNWNSSATKSWAHQICVATYLDSFCDEVAHTTPLKDVAKCHEIAASIEISYVEVRQHYKKKEAKYRIQENKAKNGVTEEFGAFRVKLPNTNFTSQWQRKEEAKLQALRERIERKARQMEEEAEDVDIEMNEEPTEDHLAMPEEEKEKILHWCVIMDKHALSVEGAIANVIQSSTGLRPNRVQHALVSLLRHPSWRERKAELDSIWAELFYTGIELGLYMKAQATEKALTAQFHYFYNESAKFQA